MSAESCFDKVAQRILAAHSAPDLRGVTVLLPNLHVVRPLAAALVRCAGVPALLLPQMVTLDGWAEQVPQDALLMPESQRAALLYQELRKSGRFGQADLWAMTRELLGLFDELTLSLQSLPKDEAAFLATVQAAWQSRQNEVLQLEARLVFELWHAMQQGEALDVARARQKRLAALAAQAGRPLYVLQVSEWDAVERQFLEAYRQRAPVEVFDLRAMVGAPPPAPRFFAATSLEQEARAARMQVRLWLHAGRRDIAVVVQDRLVARRLRALLERDGVWVADETGWTFATLSVSTVLDRWLSALQSNFYHHDLLDLFKSPFIFADQPVEARKQAVYRLEQLLRRQGVVSGLEALCELAASEREVYPLLMRLHEAVALLEPSRERTLAGWLAALQQSLEKLGITHGLRQDEAGRQLLRTLGDWQRELAKDVGHYRFHEWRRWLAMQLDGETFRDAGVESPVRFTHLAATRWRVFDAVLLLGCGADHLPGRLEGGVFFNDAVRGALGLPTRSVQANRQRDDLHGLLALNEEVLVTWQKDRNGEPQLLSPFLQWLCDQSGGGPIHEKTLARLLEQEDASTVQFPEARQPAPQVEAKAVPARISISAYNALVACPYQFYARHILHLNELDEVQETIEKRDYGERVHRILQCFHERFPATAGHDPAHLSAQLRHISEEVFADLLARDFTARAWLARWYQVLPAYLEWQAQCEAEGWRYEAAEKSFERDWGDIRLVGRIDRLDRRNGETRVIDYKTQDDRQLRHKLKEAGEDVQLACYAYAEGAVEAAFLSLGKETVKLVTPPHDINELARLNAERLQHVMARIRDGAGLVANGDETSCRHCEMRGLCRRGEW